MAEAPTREELPSIDAYKFDTRELGPVFKRPDDGNIRSHQVLNDSIFFFIPQIVEN